MGARVEGFGAVRQRAHATVLALAFFSGVVLCTVALGVTASLLGRLLAEWSAAFAAMTAVLSVSVGLAAIFGPQMRQRFAAPSIERRAGISGAFLYGLMYTLATVTSGAGPLLLLLTVAAAIGRPLYGAALSLAYGIGRGAPFLVLGIFAGAVGSWLTRIDRMRRAAEITSGLMLIAIGGYFGWLAYALAKT